jgi:ribosomal protein S18 acetylase RimI-like enzyme
MKASDLVHLQQANLNCLAENYHLWFWIFHQLLCPQTSHVALNQKGNVIGYVLSKLDDDVQKPQKQKDIHGALTSVAVFNSYRKLGIATKLIKYTHRTFRECYHVAYIDLNVRETNHAGHHLYMNTLGYKFHSSEERYYADGEAGWTLRYTFPDNDPTWNPPEEDKGTKK